MRILVLFVLLISLAAAVTDVYTATPGFSMGSPKPGSIALRLDTNYLGLTLSNYSFSLTLTAYYVANSGPAGFVTTSASGLVTFSSPQIMEFSVDNSTAGCYDDPSNRILLCPWLAEQLTGPWVYGYAPVNGNPTQVLTIMSSTQRIDPTTNKLANFLGVAKPYAFACASSPCTSLNSVTPPVPISGNVSLTVRRRNICQKRCMAAWARLDVPAQETRMQCRRDCNVDRLN